MPSHVPPNTSGLRCFFFFRINLFYLSHKALYATLISQHTHTACALFVTCLAYAPLRSDDDISTAFVKGRTGCPLHGSFEDFWKYDVVIQCFRLEHHVTLAFGHTQTLNLIVLSSSATEHLFPPLESILHDSCSALRAMQVSGATARPVMLESGLSDGDLWKIWQLGDIDSDGHLVRVVSPFFEGFIQDYSHASPKNNTLYFF